MNDATVRPYPKLRFVCIAAASIAAGVWAGCGPPTVNLYDGSASPPADVPSVYDDRPWAAVLRDHVKDGLVDYRRLAQHPENLEQYLARIQFLGPTTTPALFNDPMSRAAYYLNVYNACVLKAVLSQNIPETMHDVRSRQLDHHYRFRVDGTVVTPADLRDLARQAVAGDARVEFAMCDAARGSPPLSAHPFYSHDLADQLRHLAQEAMDNQNIVRVDHEGQRLLLGLAIWRRRDDFKAQYRRDTDSQTVTILNCLMHMASGVRRQYLSRATGYDTRMLPFDRGLNIWTPLPS